MAEKVLKATGELVDMNPQVVEELNSWTLCGARHTLQVGVTKHQEILTPFDDYFVVAFHGQDTSGGGLAMEKTIALLTPIIEGGKNIAHDIEVLFTTAQTNYEDCVAENGAWNCKWLLAQTSAVTSVSDTAAKYKTIFCLGGLLCAETDYSPYTNRPISKAEESKVFGVGDATDCDGVKVLGVGWKDLTGGCYHGLEGNTHKIRIEITNTFNDKTVKKYDSELAGCPAQYNPDDEWCFNGSVYKRFFINSPGTWTIKITPLATATCNMLEYEHTWTYEVPEPADWQPTIITTMSNNVSEVLQNAGIPVYVTPVALVGGMSLIGGLLFFKLYKKKKANTE